MQLNSDGGNGAVQENVVIIYTESAAGNCMTAAVRRIPEDLNR